MDLSWSALGWMLRASQAVGADRFFEALERAQFYLDRTRAYAHTPAERAIVGGLDEMLGQLIDADRDAREMLKESVSGMNAAEAGEFVELCESGDEMPGIL
jgi:F420-dependent methylenetetrahydromethanopterin dehydrogenase